MIVYEILLLSVFFYSCIHVVLIESKKDMERSMALMCAITALASAAVIHHIG